MKPRVCSRTKRAVSYPQAPLWMSLALRVNCESGTWRTMGGSCNGSPTNSNLLHWNWITGNMAAGSTICEHSSSTTISNWALPSANAVFAAQDEIVVPTRYLAVCAPTTKRRSVKQGRQAFQNVQSLHLYGINELHTNKYKRHRKKNAHVESRSIPEL